MAYSYEIDYCAEDCDSPRGWDNLGTMITWHSRYNLGDEQPRQSPSEWLEQYKRDNPTAVILPLYLYDHSGITIKTTPFSCYWDSGQVGYIYTTLERAREFGHSWKRLTAERREKLENWLDNEVKEYDQFLRGEVYCFKVLDDDGDEVDSGFGYYDRDECEQVALEAVRWAENHHREAA